MYPIILSYVIQLFNNEKIMFCLKVKFVPHINTDSVIKSDKFLLYRGKSLFVLRDIKSHRLKSCGKI